MRILLADDDSVTQRLLSRTLQIAGFDPVVVGDGLAAWERLQAEYFPILIVDWVMPGLDGPSLIRQVRKTTFSGYVYTILLTSRQAQDDRVDGLESGADDFLTKPVDLRELRARLAVASRIIQLETRLREANARLAYQASHDRLTDLFNRPTITEYAESELARMRRTGQSLSLALLDLDEFKAINDSYGHMAGDVALRHVGQRITSTVRPYDWVGRWGGEEFLIVLPAADMAQAFAVAERVRSSIAAEALSLDNEQQVTLTLSGGVTSSAGRDDVSVDTLFAEADKALYSAKHAGRNRIMCAEEATAAS
ncbi:MAG: diguanylate cyclase [Candidatus Viridilinea halotolerans]|uniref:Diguanylate cyclase n=1 Tax=Candidatus Viridilinea halotolerans TaxID=2491704 RepID=A0A426TZG3_9CHLR|nr:MAG: diguanylate cyclase [Candidatus Viridilinea halotolerans]